MGLPGTEPRGSQVGAISQAPAASGGWVKPNKPFKGIPGDLGGGAKSTCVIRLAHQAKW